MIFKLCMRNTPISKPNKTTLDFGEGFQYIFTHDCIKTRVLQTQSYHLQGLKAIRMRLKGIECNEILIKIHAFSFNKIHLKIPWKYGIKLLICTIISVACLMRHEKTYSRQICFIAPYLPIPNVEKQVVWFWLCIASILCPGREVHWSACLSEFDNF